MASPTLHKQTLTFLEGLADFNDKEFFDLYKNLYLTIKDDFTVFVQGLIDFIALGDDDFAELEAKKCLFRIYKDMRRPRNREAPYKTNLGASIKPGGKKTPGSGYYLHVEPGQTMLCVGVWRPQAAVAYPIRDAIYLQWERFDSILADLQGSDFVPLRAYRELLSNPRRKSRYSTILHHIPDHHMSLDYLAMKDWYICAPIADAVVVSDGLFEHCQRLIDDGRAFHEFLVDAVG